MACDRVELAVACLRLAAADDDDPERLRLTALLAAAEWRMNPAKAARYLPELIVGVRCGHLNGRYLAIVVKLLVWYGRIDDVQDAIGSVSCRDDSPDRPTDRTPARVKLSLACWYPAKFDRAERDTSAIKRDPLMPELDLELDAMTALANVMIDGGNDVTIGRAQRVLETARLDDATLEPITSALLALVYADRIDKAARWCSALMEQADSRKAAMWQAVLTTVHSEIAFRMGALPIAKSNARSALAHLPTSGWGVAIGAPLSSLLLASSAMGDFDEASRWLARPLPDTIFSSRFGVQYLYGRGSLFLATGRLDAALSDFTSCGELVVAWDMDLPAFIPWRTAAAAVYLAMGRQDAARSLIDDQLARPGAQAGRIRGVTLRILAAASELKERPVLLSEAIDLLQAGRDRFELARAVADLGQAQRALGQVSRSRMTYRFAETVAKQCCAKPLLTATRLANRSEGPPKAPARTLSSVDGGAPLSDAEHRVAARAVRGDTNSEIARRLFITVSTVEQHLTRVYRKLNVTGRTQLPASLSKPNWEPGFVVGPVDVLSASDRTAT